LQTAENLSRRRDWHQLNQSVHIVLETDRMLLRRFTEADGALLAALYGDPRVMRFITLEPPSLAEVQARILPGYLREYRELAHGLVPSRPSRKTRGRWPGGFPSSLQAATA
jgi:RimJ/RimL family protein N-acetyltransferase